MMRSKKLRVVFWAVVGCMTLMVALVSCLTTLLATETGSRFVVNRLQQFLPLDVGTMQGNFLTGFDIEYFEYQQQNEQGDVEARYRAEQVSFRWQPMALFYSAVAVKSLTAKRVDILLPEANPELEPSDTFWPNLALPVRIEVDELLVTRIHIAQQQANAEAATVIDINQVSGGLSLGTFNLRMRDFAVSTPDYMGILSGRVGLRYPYNAKLALQWQAKIAVAEAEQATFLEGSATVAGDIEQLMLEHLLTSPVTITSKGFVRPNLSKPPEAIGLAGDPEISLDNQIPPQQLPAMLLAKDAPIPILGGSLSVVGWLSDYAIKLDTVVEYRELPTVKVQADARGNAESINLLSLVINALPSAGQTAPLLNIKADGRVTWLPAISWDAKLQAVGIDPALLLPEYPGDLSLSLASQGELKEGLPEFDIQQLLMSGQLRGLEVSASGDLSLHNKVLEVKQLLAALGANHVRLDGKVGDISHLVWQLEAPFLEQIDSRLSGKVASHGQFVGNYKKPELNLEITANKFRFDDYSIQKLSANLATDGGELYRLVVDASRLSMAETNINSIKMHGDGKLQQHHIELDVVSDDLGSLGVGLDSAWLGDRWRGAFTRLNLDAKALPSWSLLSSKESVASLEAASLGELCLTTKVWPVRTEAEQSNKIEKPAICLVGNYSQAKGSNFNATIQDLPLRQLRRFLKDEVNIVGSLGGKISGKLAVNGELSAAIELASTPGELTYQVADEPLKRFPWQHIELSGSLAKQQAKGQLSLDWAPYGSLLASADYHLISHKLAGKIDANFVDLSPLAALIPQVDELKGFLVADAAISGSLEQPNIVGAITLAEGDVTMSQLGLHIAQLGLTLRSDAARRVTLQGSAKSGTGDLRLDSSFEGLGTEAWRLVGRLEGENFTVIDQTQLKINVSPAIELVAAPDAIRLTGNAKIPFGRIVIKALPASATQISGDVTVDEDDLKPSTVDAIPLYVNLGIAVGNDVTFSGFGLKSGVAGKLEIIKTPERDLMTSGFVEVTDGHYKAYGQELTIDRGRLIFQGPIDNPAIEIRAERVIKGTSDHVVGLEIGGSLKRPTSKVYAKPELENEGEAMALLLTGKPLAEASAGDAYVIIAAMTGLGADGEGSITGQIADTLSLDELSINADDGLEHSSLWMGKYLTKKLFVRYVVGLFDQSSRIGMRYQMTDKLRVEAESGEVQSVDVIYKIER